MVEKAYKILFVGDSSVGKTCLARRIVSGDFLEFTVNTIGSALIKYKYKTDDGKEIDYQIWDTAGQEKYRTVVPMFFKGASYICIVCALNDSKTFDSLDEWVQICHDNCPGVKFMIIGNKSDLAERKVSMDSLLLKGKDLGAEIVIECSALSGAGVNDIFYSISETQLDPVLDDDSLNSTPQLVPKDEEDPWKNKNDRCC